MKKLLCLLVCSIFTIAAFAQKCEYLKNTTKNGKPSAVSKSPLFSQLTQRADILFGIEEDTAVVALGYVEASPQPMECEANADLSLTLSDGSTMHLKALQAYKGRVRMGSGNVNESTFMPQYLITKEQLKQLASTGITGFSMSHAQGAVQKEVSEKNQKKIMNAAHCITQLL
ncbi:MAG: hypothetical protein JST76_14620 [Bacteroidetes bacterium]|nr:hypothetical protein [Bacteroidota bacterium]